VGAFTNSALDASKPLEEELGVLNVTKRRYPLSLLQGT
jgi:hypothetical protein